MKEIAKGSSMLTAVSIGEMLMRFVRTKFIALMLGTAGMGFLAQLTILFEALRVLGDIGSRRAVIKQVAEEHFKGVPSVKYRNVLQTAFLLTTVASMITALAVSVFSSRISQLLYGDTSHYPFIIFLALLLPVASFCTVVSSVVKGNLDYIAYAKYTLGAYLAVIALTPILIYAFKVWGAVAAMGLFYLMPLLGYLLFNLKKPFLHFSKGISRGALKEQFTQGFTQIYQDALAHAIRIAVAGWIVRDLGLHRMGIYQVVLTFTTVYMAVPIQAMSGYVFPLIAGAKNNEEICLAINDSFRYLMFVLVPVILGIMVLPEMLIYLLYSHEFVPAVPVLRTQIFSTLFLLMGYSCMASLAARGKLKSVVINSSLHTFIFFILASTLFPKFQLMGVAIAYSTAAFVNVLMQYAWSWHYFRTRLYPKNLKLMAMTIIWAAGAFVLLRISDHVLMRVGVLVFGIVWFLVSSKDHEREFIWTKARCCFRRLEIVERKV